MREALRNAWPGPATAGGRKALMTQPGRELKAKLTTLMCKHNVRPIARAPIPLLLPTAGPQVLEGYAATPARS